jgi:thiamine-monophosphate kinase
MGHRRSARVADTGEFPLIGILGRMVRGQRKNPALVRGIGDDCAVIRSGKSSQLVTVDAFVEGVHFNRKWTTAVDAGWKALAANISDIAAAGGKPSIAVISLELSPSMETSWVKGFYSGLLACARKYGVAVAGGNISRSTHFASHITLIGEAHKKNLARSGARPGDVLAVTGSLGGSLAGLLCLKQGLKGGAVGSAIRRHNRPVPRLAEGRMLAGVAHALIDVSDGLVHEAGLLAEASGVRMVLDVGLFPVHPAAQALAKTRLRICAEELAGTSGEEYELLAALPRNKTSWAIKRGMKIVGLVAKGKGVLVSGIPAGARPAGFDHFGS